MDNLYETTYKDVCDALGGPPTSDDIKLLLENYDTYQLKHRKVILECIQDGHSPLLLAESKMRAKGVPPESASYQSKGGHTKWASAKMRRFVRRVIYLRKRVDKGLSRRVANQFILRNEKLSRINFNTNIISLQKIISKDTFGAKIDNKKIL